MTSKVDLWDLGVFLWHRMPREKWAPLRLRSRPFGLFMEHEAESKEIKKLVLQFCDTCKVG